MTWKHRRTKEEVLVDWRAWANKELKREARRAEQYRTGPRIELFETGVPDSRRERIFGKPVRCRVCQQRFRRHNPNHGLMHHARLGDPIIRVSLSFDRYEFTVAKAYIRYNQI